jgi:hypothetical protein
LDEQDGSTEPMGDGVYKVRKVGRKKDKQKFLLVRSSCIGEYRRFTEDGDEKIIFQKV